MIKKIENNEIIRKMDELIFLDESYKINEYETMQKSDIYFYYVFIEKDEIIGFLIFTKIKNEYEIIKIGILIEYQSKGYGILFLKSILNLGVSKDIFLLEVNSSNKRAINLYEKLGFKQISIRKQYYKNNNDAIIYQLVIE
jgi:ribosomal-protein-alanine N-acetyltransferase